MAKKQAEFDGFKKNIEELDEASIAYREARDERMRLGEDEKECKAQLHDLLEKYRDELYENPTTGHLEYHFTDGEVKFIAELSSKTSTNVKVRKVREETDDDTNLALVD